MFKFITAIVSRIRADITLGKMAHGWARAGSPTPLATAVEEAGMRAHLESIRDFCSKAFLETGAPIDALKTRWLNERLKPMIPAIGQTRAETLKAILADMPVAELFHPQALKVWRAEATALQNYWLREGRRMYGPSGMSPELQRVLGGAR